MTKGQKVTLKSGMTMTDSDQTSREPEDWWRCRRAAKVLDITPRELRKKVRFKLISAHRVGGENGRLYFEPQEIARYQQSHKKVGRKGS